MWPSIKRWRDWAMHDLWSMQRVSPQPQALHFSYEKAGLTIHDEPIPWNAEAVLVEALLRLPPSLNRHKADFHVRVPGQEPILAESLYPQSGPDRTRLIFRLPAPSRTIVAELYWCDYSLGQVTLPFLSQDEFLQQLRLQQPTFFIRLGDENVACWTFVSSQCRGLTGNVLLTSPTSLVPLLDLGLHLELRHERGSTAQAVPARLSSSQLAEHQALICVVPRRFPRRIGAWSASWKVAGRTLAAQRLRAISRRHFQRSLHVPEARFVVQKPGEEVRLVRQFPTLLDAMRVGPCFFVSSKEEGMAGLCSVQVRYQSAASGQVTRMPEQEILITDGPTLIAPGTVAASDLYQVNAFELLIRGKSASLLPLSPVPVASFTSEGGYKPPPDFTWSPGAEEELNDRLSRLLERHGKCDGPEQIRQP